MKRVFTVLASLLLLCAATFEGGVTAQDEPDVSDYVARAQRLREFGYPLYARAQLDKAKQIDPTNRELLLEYMRLYNNYRDATTREMQQYVTALRDLYPDDYEASLEVAWWLYYIEPTPEPPAYKSEEDLKRVLTRLDREMEVYREHARYILKPEGEAPKTESPRPALPLAYLARCARAKPGTAEVQFFAARDLERRAFDFDQWSGSDENLEKPFGLAARELYGLALPLYREAGKSNAYNVGAKVTIAQVLYRMGEYEDAWRACTAAEIQAPGNDTIAETRLAIAEKLRDYGLLKDALTRMHAIFDDISSQLDLMVVERLIENEWSFDVWLAWREIAAISQGEYEDRSMLIERRAGAIHTMLRARPELIELHYRDARNALDLAEIPGQTPEQRAHLYRVVLAALDKCESMGDTFADWHGIRAAALWSLGRYEDAAKAYDRVAALDEHDEEAIKHAQAARNIAAGLYNAADYEAYRAQLAYGDLREKRDVLRTVVRRSPRFFSAQLLLGKVAFMLADFETAYGAYAAGHKLRPENLECLDGVARAAMRTDRIGESLKYFVKLNELEPDFQGALRWEGIVRWVVDGGDDRRRAFRMWIEASAAQMDQRSKKELLEQAVTLETEFAEALVDLAVINRGDDRFARNYLERALKTARDDYTRAAAHRARGQVHLGAGEFPNAIADFEAAYGFNKSDGMDLLLAALAHHELGQEARASAKMRQLFAETPETMLLRPPVSDVGTLELAPVASDGIARVHPAYDVGDVARFRVRIDVSGEGGNQSGRETTLEYDLRMEVLDKPLHGGIWRVKVSTEDAPQPFRQLNGLSFELKISPWFGMLNEPAVGGMDEIVNPALQAITEGLTVGIGDAPVPPPYVWKTDLTVGPPHFGGDSVEGGALIERLGDSLVVQRRALAGRQISNREDQHSFGRALEARVTLAGNKRVLREVEFQILKKELTPAKDDVVKSRLFVKLTAK